jgi:hypothetical protein
MADEQPAPASPQGEQKTNVMAILSLIFAIIPPFQLLGLIFGIIALVQLGKGKNQKGKGLAIAGIIVSIVLMILAVVCIMLLATTLFYVASQGNFTPPA